MLLIRPFNSEAPRDFGWLLIVGTLYSARKNGDTICAWPIENNLLGVRNEFNGASRVWRALGKTDSARQQGVAQLDHRVIFPFMGS